MGKDKYRSGLKKAVDEIPISELETWSTRKLLGRLKHLRWCYEREEDASDYTREELEQLKDKLLFKSDPGWKKAYRDLKTILAHREHVER